MVGTWGVFAREYGEEERSVPANTWCLEENDIQQVHNLRQYSHVVDYLSCFIVMNLKFS